MELTRVLGGVVLLAMLHQPARALGQNLLAPYTVNLAWGASPSPEVTGYRVYYGPASGNYTNSIRVGKVTTNTIQGLTGGVAYYIAVTAYNASAQESPFSNEISFVAGLPAVQIRLTANRQVVLTVKGLAGHTYDIQVTPDLKTWSNLSSVTVPTGGSVDFTDPTAASVARRFYRARDIQP